MWWHLEICGNVYDYVRGMEICGSVHEYVVGMEVWGDVQECVTVCEQMGCMCECVQLFGNQWGCVVICGNGSEFVGGGWNVWQYVRKPREHVGCAWEQSGSTWEYVRNKRAICGEYGPVSA